MQSFGRKRNTAPRVNDKIMDMINNINLGINTFGLAKLLHGDFDGTLRKLRDLGYSSIEPLIFFDKHISKLEGGIWSYTVNAEKRIAAARAMGFALPSVQVFGDIESFLTCGLDNAISFLKKSAVKYLVVSPMKHSFPDAASLCPLLAIASEKLSTNGLSLVLHTHEQEFACNERGATQLELYLSAAPHLMLELDVGWALFAGKDPVGIITEMRDRITLIHLKDIKLGMPRNSCFTAIGKGDLPLEDILSASTLLARLDENGVIVDQDKSNGSLMEDLAFCSKNILTLFSK